jgi:hypothetical protein
MMHQSIDEYYKDVMAHGTGPAKILITEEALLASGLANRIVDDALSAVPAQREIMAALHSHRAMVIANFLLERAEGHPMNHEGPVVTANLIKPGIDEQI